MCWDERENVSGIDLQRRGSDLSLPVVLPPVLLFSAAEHDGYVFETPHGAIWAAALAELSAWWRWAGWTTQRLNQVLLNWFVNVLTLWRLWSSHENASTSFTFSSYVTQVDVSVLALACRPEAEISWKISRVWQHDEPITDTHLNQEHWGPGAGGRGAGLHTRPQL